MEGYAEGLLVGGKLAELEAEMKLVKADIQTLSRMLGNLEQKVKKLEDKEK